MLRGYTYTLNIPHFPRKHSIMSNLSTCSPSTIQSVPYLYSCGVPLVPGRNTTNNTAVLQSCCPTSNISTYGFPDPCWAYCNATTKLQAEEMYWCLGNLSSTDPNNTIEAIGCDLGASGSGSGAGRLAGVLGGGWASVLLVLGIAASAVATVS